jgi:NAD(P)-dependent dehydrogenase (short-subunit alcohol dehydrogenase family)
VALALAAGGADVGLVYRHSRAEADRTASDIRALGRRAVVLQADLSDPAACRAVVDDTAHALGRLDVLVHLASVYERVAFDALNHDAWRRALAVDLDAAFRCAKAATPHMRAAGGGRIVLCSDWVAASGRPRYRGYVGYNVAKSAVIAQAQALALELASNGILVNAIAPGPIVPPDDAPERWRRAAIAETPLGRWGGEQEVARAVMAIVSSGFVTGETVRVDGGRHLR